MIKELEKLYHRYEEQEKVYAKYSSKLSIEEKYSLIYEFLSNKRDFWGYLQLITDIALEISENSDTFITLIVNIGRKTKGDLAQKPFMDLLIQLGTKDFGLNLYNSIMDNKFLDDDFKIISGLILGGYHLENKVPKINLRLKEPLKFPTTNSYLRSLLVIYEHKNIDNLIKNYLNNIFKSNDKKLLEELTFIFLSFYKKDPSFFYGYIKKLILLNDFKISWLIFNKLNYKNLFSKKETFELISLAKDFDIKIIDLIVESFRKYPEEHKKVVDLLIYWFNKFDKFEFDSQNLMWILEGLVKINKYFIKEFFEKYKEIQPRKKSYLFTFPYLFEVLSKYHQNYVLNQILKFKVRNKEDKNVFLDLCKKLIGNLYNDVNQKDLVIKLNDRLIKLIENKDFVSFNKKKYLKKRNKIQLTGEINKNDYGYLIDIAKNLLDKLRFRKETYDFKLIRKNLLKYSFFDDITRDLINSFEEKKQFSSLLWLGESEEPKLNEIKIDKNETELSKVMKFSYTRSQFWSRAYLKELNLALKKYLSLSNEKYTTLKRLRKNVLGDLSNEDKFWNFESELIFINRFSEKVISFTEPKVPHRYGKNLDLKINLFKRDIYFEITRPKVYRNLGLSNGALAIPNKAIYAIKSKFENQIKSESTLNEMIIGKRKDVFFIVIDISGSSIDEYGIMNAFYGSLAFTLVMDKKQGKIVQEYPSRIDDSIHKADSDTDIISGVIYFKQELMFDAKNQPFIKLKGNIIQNPNGINVLNENELKKLRKMIFD